MDGVLVINKPKGMTSFDVIRWLKRKYKMTKFGHTGTLDPDAEGVLVILCGKACKALQFLTDTDKTYIAQIELGKQTTTDDCSGEILYQKEINYNFDFEAVLSSFQGPLHQRVPNTSSKKVNGMKLMEYQRKGLEIPEVYQDVTIYEIRSLGFPRFEVRCSSGTYIRSICRDFGKKTDNFACMKSLIRTCTSGFNLEQAQTLEQLETQEPVLHSIKTVLQGIPMVEYNDIRSIYQGKPIVLQHSAERICITENGEPVAIYDRIEKDQFISKRGLW